MSAGSVASAAALDRDGLTITAFADRSRAYDAAAEAVAASLRRGLARRGWASFAASGAASAAPAHRRLGGRLGDWSRVAVTLTDDLFAPPTHPASRAAGFAAAFLAPRTRAARFFPLWSACGCAEAAAFGASEAIAPLRPFDSVLLAMEDDGEAPAALRGPALCAAAGAGPRAAVVAQDGGADGPRLSLTAEAVGAARVILLAFGPRQLESLARAHRDQRPLAAGLRRLRAELFWAA